MEEAGLASLDLIACEGVVSMVQEQLNPLAGEVWERWVDLNYRLGQIQACTAWPRTCCTWGESEVRSQTQTSEST